MQVKASMACTMASMPVRQQQWRDDSLLLDVADRDDRDRRHFRAGPGGRRNENQRQSRAASLADSIDRSELFTPRREQRYQLGDVHRGPASQSDDARGREIPRACRGRLHREFAGIGLDRVEQFARERRCAQARERRLDQARPHEPGVADHEDTCSESRARNLTEARQRAGAEDDRAGRREREAVH
jgi:hypothetical protein